MQLSSTSKWTVYSCTNSTGTKRTTTGFPTTHGQPLPSTINFESAHPTLGFDVREGLGFEESDGLGFDE